MGISVPLAARGIVITKSDSVSRRLNFEEEASPAVTTAVPYRIPRKPASPLPKVHLRSRPISKVPAPGKLPFEPLGDYKKLRPHAPPPQSLDLHRRTRRLFDNRKKALKSASKKKKQVQAPPPRKSHPLIDDSAIESDGQGGDLDSTTTTPEVNVSPEVIEIDSPNPPPPKPIVSALKSKNPRVACDICGHFVSNSHQLRQHQNGKKCRAKTARRNISNIDLYCSTCKKTFLTIHNFHNHKC